MTLDDLREAFIQGQIELTEMDLICRSPSSKEHFYEDFSKVFDRSVEGWAVWYRKNQHSLKPNDPSHKCGRAAIIYTTALYQGMDAAMVWKLANG